LGKARLEQRWRCQHDWRNYISEEVQGMWDTFPDDQKQALAQQANQIAGREDWD